MGSGDLLEDLPLVLMAIGFIIVFYYIARNEIRINSVFKNLKKLGNLTGTDRSYPGIHGVLNGRQFNCYYKNVGSKSASFLFLLAFGIKIPAGKDANKVLIDTYIVMSVGLKNYNPYTLKIPKDYFAFQNLPNEFRDRNTWQLMYNIVCSKDFKRFDRILIETDSIKYYHQFTGMNMDYMQNILRLLFSFADHAEKIGPVFRIKGFDY